MTGNTTSSPHRREISDAEVDLLSTTFTELSGEEVSAAEVRERGRRIVEMEQKMLGRFAGHLADYVASYLAARIAARLFRGEPDVAFCEIGCLHGGSLLVTLGALDDAGSRAKVVVVDPLNGFYPDLHGKEAIDPYSQVPVSADTLRENLRRFGFAQERIQLIQRPSADPVVREELGQRRLGFALIDGDHSFAGVKSDFELCASRVAEGGLILLDNFADLFWPDITSYVAKELIPGDSRFQPFYAFSRSLAMRRGKGRAGLGMQVFSQAQAFLDLVDRLKRAEKRGAEVERQRSEAERLRAEADKLRARVKQLGEEKETVVGRLREANAKAGAAEARAYQLDQEIGLLKASPTFRLGRLIVRAGHGVTLGLLKGKQEKIPFLRSRQKH